MAARVDVDTLHEPHVGVEDQIGGLTRGQVRSRAGAPDGGDAHPALKVGDGRRLLARARDEDVEDLPAGVDAARDRLRRLGPSVGGTRDGWPPEPGAEDGARGPRGACDESPAGDGRGGQTAMVMVMPG